MISSRSKVRWVLFGLLAAGMAACTGERADPDWELVFGMSSSGASSSGTASSGSGGSTTSSGSGGSTTSSGTGGAGGTPVDCDGTGVCQTCVDCSLTSIPCGAQWDTCQANNLCLLHIGCEQLASTNCANDPNPAGCFALAIDVCTLQYVGSGFEALRLCFCSTACAQDCAADLSFHCVDQLPAQ